MLGSVIRTPTPLAVHVNQCSYFLIKTYVVVTQRTGFLVQQIRISEILHRDRKLILPLLLSNVIM